jgi:putative transposase
MLSVEQSSELVQYACRRLALKSADHITQYNGRRVTKQEVDVIALAVNLRNFAVALRSELTQDLEQKISPLSGEYMPTKFCTENDVSRQVVDAVACCVKVKIPDTLAHGLEDLLVRCSSAVERMLSDRNLSSSKYYSDLLPCVVSKSLITKYQKNSKCKRVRNLVIPICGDKGKQIKRVEGGIQIPALFKKHVLPVQWPREVTGHIRSIEILRRSGQWFASICYNSPKPASVHVDAVIGVDRNSVGNVAVLADPQTGTVRKLGICPARTKFVFRRRRKNLQRSGKTRLLKKLFRKQRRRMSYENHRATRAVVDYAAKHHRAVVMEKLENVQSAKSKIRRYSEKNQWAFAQFGSMLRYKCALRGIPLFEVNPAYTSQTCSECGSIHKPNGKQFICLTCGHNDHRDANAAFNIARRGMPIAGSSSGLSVSGLRPIGGPLTETIGDPHVRK